MIPCIHRFQFLSPYLGIEFGNGCLASVQGNLFDHVVSGAQTVFHPAIDLCLNILTLYQVQLF